MATAVVAVAASAGAIAVVAAEQTAQLLELVVAAESPAPAKLEVPPELAVIATTIGHAWAQQYMNALEGQGREIVGAWPGTLREARRHVLVRLQDKLEPELLDHLARLVNLAARRGWESVSEPDQES